MANEKKERRTSGTDSDADYNVPDVAMEKREGSDYPIMAGYAATFGNLSRNLGGFVEIIEPGFFRNAILPENLKAYSLFNHDPSLLLGATRNGELTVKEDEIGLYQETILKGDTSVSRDVAAHIEAGRLHKMSFAFNTVKGGDKWTTEGRMNKRTLLPDGCGELFDTSPVTYPAYEATSVGMRSLVEEDEDLNAAMVALVRIEKNLPTTKEDMENIRQFRSRVDAYVQGVSPQEKINVLDIKRRMLLLLA